MRERAERGRWKPSMGTRTAKGEEGGGGGWCLSSLFVGGVDVAGEEEVVVVEELRPEKDALCSSLRRATTRAARVDLPEPGMPEMAMRRRWLGEGKEEEEEEARAACFAVFRTKEVRL